MHNEGGPEVTDMRGHYRGRASRVLTVPAGVSEAHERPLNKGFAHQVVNHTLYWVLQLQKKKKVNKTSVNI